MRALLLAVLVVACAGSPRDHGELNDVLTGLVAPDPYYIGALRFNRPQTFALLRAQVEARLEAEAAAWQAVPSSERPSKCARDLPNRLALLRWAQLAEASPDLTSWNEDASTLHQRLNEIRAAADALAEGAAETDARVPFTQLEDLVQARAGATDARLRELFSRTLRDQTLRKGFGDARDPTVGWRAGLSPRAQEAWRGLLGSLIVETDCSNSAWLEAQLREIAWFDRRVYGASADDAAWLLVQHADYSPAFQEATLRVLEPLVDRGGTRASNFAYLSDRVAMAAGRPQRFGTQMHCLDGQIAPVGGLEEPELVEARRTAMGLQTFASYRTMMAQLNGCAAAG